MIASSSFVSILINYIVHTYFLDTVSVCVVWNDDFQFDYQQLNTESYAVIVSLHYKKMIGDGDVPSDSLEFMTKFEKILVESIERTHCESFIVFEDDIAGFVNSFMKAIIHSQWHSLNNRFLFVYNKDHFNASSEFTQDFFKDIANILFVEIINETLFELKTTKYVGSRKDHPEQLIFLDRYHGDTSVFEFNRNLYPDKIRDLMGREVISAAFSYEPFTILKNDTMANVMDVAHGNEDPSKRLLYDGTDAQILFHLCSLYNCSIQVDSSEPGEWGSVYDNFTADGALGLVSERKADIAMMAMYMLHDYYLHLDMTAFLSRSGVTCLVPAPRRLISWLLPLEPFNWLLWLSIAGCLGLEAVGLLFTLWANKLENISWTESVCFGFITTLKIFVSQSCNYLPSSVSVRIVLFSCYITDVILTSIYSGGLSSILTIPTLEEVADSVERLARHNIVWVATAYNWILAINDTEEELIKRVVDKFRVYTAAEIKQNREYTHTGYVTERMTFGHFVLPNYLDQGMVDHLKVMIDDIYYQYCVAYVQRSWPLLEKFNNLVIMMQSSGMTQFLEWKVVAEHMNDNLQKQLESSAKSTFEDIGPVQLGLENFAGIVAILIIGTTCSIIIFLGELIYYNYWTNSHADRFA